MAAGRYFRYPDLTGAFLTTVGFSFLTMSKLCPASIPAIFGPIGKLAAYLGINFPIIITCLFIFFWGAHVIEALVSLKLSRERNLNCGTALKWFIQTFFFGYESLKYLQAYEVKKL